MADDKMGSKTSGGTSSNIPSSSKGVSGKAQGGIMTPFTDAVTTSVGKGKK